MSVELKLLSLLLFGFCPACVVVTVLLLGTGETVSRNIFESSSFLQRRDSDSSCSEISDISGMSSEGWRPMTGEFW